MKRYIVKIEDSDTRERLSDHFEKVGKGKQLTNKVIVETDQEDALDTIKRTPGVIWVYEDDYFVPEGDIITHHHTESWFVNRISDEDDVLLTRSYGEHADIYVLDTGMRLDHIEYQGRAQTLFSHDHNDFTTSGSAPAHGAQVASCAAGSTCGVARKAQIYNLRFDMSYSEAVKAADEILDHHRQKDAKRVSIFNMSFGGSHPMIREEIEDLTRAGVICIAAAGNEAEKRAMYPARERKVLSIGASNRRDRISSFSNYGRQIDLFAPGSNGIMAGVEDPHQYLRASGTSFAAPIVAGVIATITEPGSVHDERDVKAVFRHIKKHSFQGELTKARGQSGSPNKIINALTPIWAG